jgi:hypothetical protein
VSPHLCLKLLRELRRGKVGIPVVLITASRDEIARSQMLDDGAVEQSNVWSSLLGEIQGQHLLQQFMGIGIRCPSVPLSHRLCRQFSSCSLDRSAMRATVMSLHCGQLVTQFQGIGKTSTS